MALPIEIWEQIFSYIDPINLTRIKIVCNSWREIINNILKESDLWYTKCKEEIPQNEWKLLFETLYPNRSYVDLINASKKEKIWMNMYKWWFKCKQLITCDIFIDTLYPLPKDQCLEFITCIAVLGNILAIGTSKGYIYLFNTDDLSNKSMCVANHMESVLKVKFLKNSKKIILASSSINDHIKFWDFQSKNLILKDRGKLLCTSQSYCYTIIENILIVQGCIPKTSYELPVNHIVAGTADCNKVCFYTEEEYGSIGFSIYGKKWKFFDALSIFHGRPTAVLIYGSLLILGIETGHVYIYYVNNWNKLHLKFSIARLIIVGKEPIVSLNISTHFTDCLIVASKKEVHFIHFM
ncbi:PREDICTED: uncharacterized protein LOC106791446 isoform X2 [Polistes canadensis]|uniref:uncharacterized protein LOC106791446 isoform X2 n=1 Tax=Polistes canadensis TaxID=91411 RepID=UPI000718F804|nr:PREDICTED: uncharacterized protein LOC106791446 isoform X2 [Polistes canadensis]